MRYPLGKSVTRVHLVKRYFKPLLKKARLPTTIRFYDLRHSFVMLHSFAGVGAETVSKQAGHAIVAFTLDYFAPVLPVMQETACDKLERLLSKRQAVFISACTQPGEKARFHSGIELSFING